VLILENAYYSVISPEGCAAILWKDRANAAQAAAALKMTAKDLAELDIVDEVIPEPLGGAHKDYDTTAASLKKAILKNLEKLSALKPAELLAARYQKYRKLGVMAKAEPKKRKPATRKPKTVKAAAST
jgi:acetyl-CoA carboxylase carboxyl transferase subunit alpha